MVLKPGSFVASDQLTVSDFDGVEYDFCCKLYPRGGGHTAKRTILGQNSNNNQGFGMAYAMNSEVNEKVGAYLQFIPRKPNQTVDASFALRLLGRQVEGPRFDVEWRAGMRFVPIEQGKLWNGQANDFGAHLMHTHLLAGFLGVTEEAYFDNQDPVQMQVEIQLHKDPKSIQSTDDDQAATALTSKASDESVFATGFGLLSLLKVSPFLRDIRGDDNAKNHDTDLVRVGRVVVPIVQRLSQRNAMFHAGCYPGVEYRILRIVDDEANDRDLFYSQPNAIYELKPIYPLVQQLERPWPVRVRESDIPKLYTPSMYNAVSAIGSLLTAVTGLATAFLLSQAVSFFYIPSRSMDPTLEVGDVLLVDKVTPRLPWTRPAVGDIVLFSPPDSLQTIVQQTGGSISSRDLFVKRVAAQAGDVVTVDANFVDRGSVKINGKPAPGRRDLCTAEPLGLLRKFLPTETTERIVQPGTVEVLGDCSSVSIDSRVWGALTQDNIVGKPIVRLWPISKFGPLPSSLPALTTNWSE
jgi:signal peptidase I